MLDPLVQHLQVTTQTNFSPTGKATPATQYTYFIGDHGPFTDRYDEGKDTVDAVSAGIQARVDKLRAVGALPPAS